MVIVPERRSNRPRDHRGSVVGEPDFRVVDPDAMRACLRGRCWLCGGTMGRNYVHVIGPMCAVNRISSEPGSHRDCARYAAQACPFLAQPRMRRNEKPVPEGAAVTDGHLDRNPGVCVLWTTKGPSRPQRAGAGLIFELPEPVAVEWWHRGRPATRAEADEALERGVAEALRPVAEKEGGQALAVLAQAVAKVRPLLPPLPV
jgi:hypothetical protein